MTLRLQILHSRGTRGAMSLLLLLATQLALAGQICQSVMVGGIDGRLPAHVAASAAAPVTSEAQPCCDRTPVSSIDCPTALVGAMNPPDASLVNVHAASSALPMHFVSALPVIDRSARRVVAFPAAPAGPALPAYIVYGRFLS